MDKIPNGKIECHGKFFTWLDNFWYHNKWKTIGIAFALIVIFICVLQTCEKESTDVYVLYGGPDTFTDAEKINNIRNALGSVLPEDYNGDGKKYVEWISNFIMSKEEIEAAKSKNDNGNFYVDSALISDNLKNFQNLILAGEYSVCFLSPYLYNMVNEAGGFMSLTEIFDEAPQGAIDEYGIRLSETDFGRYFAGINALPEDTIICMRKVTSFGALLKKNSTENSHKQALELFKAIVEFEAPNDR